MNTKVKGPILLLLMVLSVYLSSAQTKCPTNFDGKSFVKIKYDMDKHNGETVAFDSEVSEIRKGYNDIPYFKVKLENGEELWITSVVSDKYVVKGAKLRLIGYIELVQADDEIARQFNRTGYHVRVFAMVDHKTKQLQSSNAFDQEVKQWLGGQFPADLNR